MTGRDGLCYVSDFLRTMGQSPSSQAIIMIEVAPQRRDWPMVYYGPHPQPHPPSPKGAKCNSLGSASPVGIAAACIDISKLGVPAAWLAASPMNSTAIQRETAYESPSCSCTCTSFRFPADPRASPPPSIRKRSGAGREEGPDQRATHQGKRHNSQRFQQALAEIGVID